MKQKKGKQVTYSELTKICTGILKVAGVSKKHSEAVAHHLVEADLCGHESHGVAVRLPRYLGLVKDGKLNPSAEIQTAVESPSMMVLDGGWCFGQVVANLALEICSTKARSAGAYSVTFRNTNHIGRLGYYGEIAARKGLIFFMTASVLPGSRQSHPDSPKAVMGTNPICFAFKWNDRLILSDTSTSAIAEGKVALLRARGEKAPPGTLRDHRGNESLDPAVLYTEPFGSMWPLGGPSGGHKGFALAVMVDLMSGLASGGGLSGSDVPPGANCGFMHIIDPKHFVKKKRIDEMMEIWIEKMHTAHSLSGEETIILPGDMEMKNRKERLKSGIHIDSKSWNELEKTARVYGVNVSEILKT